MSSQVCKRTLCVKNLPQPSDNLVSSLFGPLGGVLLKVITAGDTNRKDILVEFESEELASKARDAMHGKVVDGTNLFVDYAYPGQSSFTSPSKDKAQKKKVSVLDRIIKPGNAKSSNGGDKNRGAASQLSGKEDASSDNPDMSSTSQQKVPFDDEIEQGQLIPAPSVVKRGKGGDGFQHHGGGHEKKNNKKSFNTTKGNHRGQHKGQRKLEIIKPKQDPARILEQTAQFIPKEISSLIKTNPELNENPQLVKTVYELVQKKFETSSKDVANRTDSKTNAYDSSVKNKNLSRSRTRSRGPSYPRNNRSYSRDRKDPYYCSKSRRSRSPSSGQKRGWAPRSRSRSQSYDRRRDYSYSSHRDSYYDRYKSSYYKRSRSRSNPRKEYSPYRDRPIRREDDRYDYKDRRSASRPRSRSRTWSRSVSPGRNGYRSYRNRSSRSRSRSRSVYDSSYRKEDGGASKSRYVAKGGLVIEKKNNVNRKLEGSYGRDDRFERKDYSRSRSVDRLHIRNSRSGSRDRHREADRYKYGGNRGNSGNHEGNRKKKALGVRNESNIDKNAKNQGQTGDRKRGERREGNNGNYAQKEKMELVNNVGKGSGPNELESANNYANISNLQQLFPNNLINYSNFQGGCQMSDHNISLPTYLYPAGSGDYNDYSSVEYGAASEINIVHREGDRGANRKEEKETLNLENSTTENSNVDLRKSEEKGDGDHKKECLSDFSERTSNDVEDKKVDSGLSITNEFIKKNKMQAFINYIIATGDIQGLKEKLKSVEKPKE